LSQASDPRAPRDIRLLGAAGVAATGLALAIAASGEPEQVAAVESIAKRLVIYIPEWLKLTVLLALGLAALLVLGLFARMSHKRRKDEESLELYYEPPKLTARDYVFLVLLAAIPLALAGSVLWFSHWLTSSGEVAGEAPGVTTPGTALPEPPVHAPETVLVHAPGIGAIFGTLAIVIAVGALGFMLWLYFGDWLLRRSTGPLRPIMAGLDRAVAESLDDVLLEPDPRRAIIKCYGRFEAVLAAAHLARTPWQTPMEFMRSVLQRCPLPHLAVWELTRLFELARFSDHLLEAREREIAVSSLRSISQALQKQEDGRGPDT
jgi:hypothetical protein